MNQELVWIIKPFLTPPGILVLIGLIGLLKSGRAVGKLLLFLTLLVLYLLSTPYISRSLMTGLETYPPVTSARIAQEKPDAIVMLGGGRYMNAPEYGQDTLGPMLLERTRYAALLSRNTKLPVIPSGGSPKEQGMMEDFS